MCMVTYTSNSNDNPRTAVRYMWYIRTKEYEVIAEKNEEAEAFHA